MILSISNPSNSTSRPRAVNMKLIVFFFIYSFKTIRKFMTQNILFNFIAIVVSFWKETIDFLSKLIVEQDSQAISASKATFLQS